MKFRRNRGFTLVEVLVAMLIATTLMLAVIRLFTRIGETFDMNAEAMQLMESTRVALRFVKSDLTQAGYMGCLQTDVETPTGKTTPSEMLKTATNRPPNSYWGISGQDGGGNNPDQLSLFYMQDLDIRALKIDIGGVATGAPALIVDAFNLFDANGDSRLVAGDWLVVSNCWQATSFLLTNNPVSFPPTANLGFGADAVIANNQIAALQYAQGATFNGFLNTSSNLLIAEGEYNSNASGGAGMVGKYYDITYQVANSVIDNGATQSLFRLVNGEAPSSTNEIVRMVTNFQVVYGVDDDNDGVMDRTITSLQGETANNKPVQVQVSITLEGDVSNQELVNVVKIRNKGL